MSESKLPDVCDKEQMQQLLAEVENRTEEEWIDDDEAANEPTDDQTIITVPTALLPEIRRLLAKYASDHADQSDDSRVHPARANPVAGELPPGNHGRGTHHEPPGLSSRQKVVDGDLAKDRSVEDDGDVLT